MLGLCGCPKQQAATSPPAPINSAELAGFVNITLGEGADEIEGFMLAFERVRQDNTETGYVNAVYDVEFKEATSYGLFIGKFRRRNYEVQHGKLRDSIDYAFIDRRQLQLITISRRPDPEDGNAQKFRIIVLEPENEVVLDGMIDSMQKK